MGRDHSVKRLAGSLDFAVFGLGRCGTTWATAWLSRYADVLHDPILFRSFDEISKWADTRPGRAGIVCTASWMVPGFVDALKADDVPIVALHRDFSEVDASYRRLGLGGLPDAAVRRWQALEFDATDWTWLFNEHGARLILLRTIPGITLDVDHHEELRRMKIEPAPEVIEAVKRFVAGGESRYPNPETPTGRPE